MLLLASWRVGKEERGAQSRGHSSGGGVITTPQGILQHHLRWLNPHTRPQLEAPNSEPSQERRVKRLYCRLWPLEGSRQAAAVAQPQKVLRLGEERKEEGAVSRGLPGRGLGTAARESVCLTVRVTKICSQVLTRDTKRTRHLMMITVMYIYRVPTLCRALC